MGEHFNRRAAAVLFVLCGAGTALADPDPKGETHTAVAVIDAEPNEAQALSELLHWEILRLGLDGGNARLKVPPEMELGSSLRAKLTAQLPEEQRDQAAANREFTSGDLRKILEADQGLTETEAQELLGLLRTRNGGVSPESPEARARLRDEALAEARRILRDAPSGALRLPESVKEPLIARYLERLRSEGKPVPEPAEARKLLESPSGLAQVLEVARPEDLKVEDWARLVGATEMNGRQLRGGRFVADRGGEAREALEKLRRQEQPDRLGGPVQVPRQPVVPSEPPALNRAQPVAPPRTIQDGGGFPGPGPFARAGHSGGSPGAGTGRGGSRGGASRGFPVEFPAGLPGNAELTPSQEARLKALRRAGTVSLPMATVYNGDYSRVSQCQITAVKKTEVPGAQGLCSYDMATARHCVENEAGNPFSDISIAPFGQNLTVTRAEADNLGRGDMAMLTVEAQCADIPVRPLANQSPRTGDPLLIYERKLPLLAEASREPPSGNSVVVNTNHRDNFGNEIQQGSSGGAVLNERGELVGVISTKLVRDDGRPTNIGTIATMDSLEFANLFVNPNYNVRLVGGRPPRLPDLANVNATHGE